MALIIVTRRDPRYAYPFLEKNFFFLKMPPSALPIITRRDKRKAIQLWNSPCRLLASSISQSIESKRINTYAGNDLTTPEKEMKITSFDIPAADINIIQCLLHYDFIIIKGIDLSHFVVFFRLDLRVCR